MLNEMIASGMLGIDGSLLRTTDPLALEAARKEISRHDAARDAAFASALGRVGKPETRSEGCEVLDDLARKGDIEAIAQSGRCSLYGWGPAGQPDAKSGFQALERALAFGSATAAYELGKAYFEGSAGRTKDVFMAKRMLETAEVRGSPDAQVLLERIEALAQAPLPVQPSPALDDEDDTVVTCVPGVNYCGRPCCLIGQCYSARECRCRVFLPFHLAAEGCGHVGEGCGGGQRKALSTAAPGAPKAHRPHVHSLRFLR